MELPTIKFLSLTAEQCDEQCASVIKLRNRALMKAASSNEPEVRRKYERLLIERKIRLEVRKAEEREKNIESGYLTKVDFTANEQFVFKNLITARNIHNNRKPKAAPRNSGHRLEREKDKPKVEKDTPNPIPYNQSAVINPFKKKVPKIEVPNIGSTISSKSEEVSNVVIPTRQGILPILPPADKIIDRGVSSVKSSLVPSRSGSIGYPENDESSSSSSSLSKRRKITPHE